MSRRRFRKPAVTLALFPFLAVLVCTMGALIVLLVLVVQQARVYATVVDEERVTADERGSNRAREKGRHDWRRSILEQQREALRGELANSRFQLSHLEDHIRRLEKKWSQLQTAATALEQLQENSNANAAEAVAERDRLRTAADLAKQQIEELRAQQRTRSQSYAIVPYPGPNGTQRKPIFIECTAQGIVLQPEGVVLRADDFQGPLGSGNPLDAALRAVREHMVNVGGAPAEPYPLLVVRPDGAIAYNVARHAMRSWDDEFGYELIGAEIQLEYPPADPELRQLLESTVRDARDRQIALAAAMPSEFQGGGGLSGFVAEPRDTGLELLGGGGRGGSRSDADAAGYSSAHRGGDTSYSPESGGSEADINGTNVRGERLSQASESGPAGGATPGNGGNASSAHPGGSSFAVGPSGRRDNWALPADVDVSRTAISRPIRLLCRPDKLIILPERRITARPRELLMPHGPAPVIDALVEQIQHRIQQWGIAVAHGYWRPTLEIEVAPGGQSAYEELKRLLSNSGLEVVQVTR